MSAKTSIISQSAFTLLALTLGVVVALQIGGAANELLLADPGAVVRWGLPIATAITQASMAVTVGALIFAAFALPNKSAALSQTLNISAVAASLWFFAGTLQFLFTYLSVTGLAISASQDFGAQLLLFATQIELGQYLSLNLLGAALIAVLAVATRNLTGTVFAAAAGLLSLVPLALTGHAAGTANHGLAVNALGLHLAAVSIWFGGLALLLLLRWRKLITLNIVQRYSTLALIAFVLIATSGVLSAWLRIGALTNLFTAYGSLILIKSGLLVLLGLIGAWHRIRVINNWDASQLQFYKLVASEILLMAGAIGVAAALSRTAPPVNAKSEVGTSPAEILTGQKLPPEYDLVTFFTQYKIDPLWLAVCLFGLIGYWFGVRRLTQRGDKWPVGRTVSWTLGMLLLLFITNGSFNAYQEYLFSVHMMAHMLLTMAVPILLVPGAPITLISRAAAKRQDESRGLREWALWAVHSKYAQFISHPIVAGLLFSSSLVVFYYTPLFAWATREHIGHEWMVVHFLITGYLFVQALIGVDPGPHRLPFAMRIGLLILVLAFHAFFGLALMTGNGLLLADWFGAMGRTWGASPLEDQHTGGAIAWGIGELPTAALTIIVSVQWFRSDAREARRLDRAADRGDNKDFETYNAMLARLAERDAKNGDN